MMSSKSRARNLALLGGLGAAAYLASRKKDTGSDAQYEAQDKQEGYKSTPLKRAAPKAAPKPRIDERTPEQEAADDAKIFGANAPAEGVTASGLPREARGVRNPIAEGSTASGLPREARGVRAPMYTDRVRGGMKKGGMVGSASKRADGCAVKGKTRGRMI